ncbi:MAG TPA: sulfatase-like hydrolase/transferase, partial [Polyangiales bacterium]
RYLSGGSRLGANESEAQLSLVRCLAGLFAKRAAGLVDRVLFEQLGQGRHSASFQFVVYARGTRMYDEEITSWDRHFGALLARLKGRGLYDAMAIVLTSDRGRALREATPVPLLIKRPGVRARGRVEARSAQSIDLMPTVLRSIDLAIPASVQGRDLFHDDEDAGARPLER